jgi:hypothetical protein
MCATADGSFAAQRRADSVLFLEAHKLLDADIFAAVWVRLSDSGFAFRNVTKSDCLWPHCFQVTIRYHSNGSQSDKGMGKNL